MGTVKCKCGGACTPAATMAFCGSCGSLWFVSWTAAVKKGSVI